MVRQSSCVGEISERSSDLCLVCVGGGGEQKLSTEYQMQNYPKVVLYGVTLNPNKSNKILRLDSTFWHLI